MTNENVNCHIFKARNQKQDDSYTNYLTELQKLAQHCNFGELKERMIKDRIIAAINDSKLRNRLLMENQLYY